MNIVNSYKFTLPYKVNWVGQFDDIDVFNNLEDCKEAFKSIPILIFKNQKLTNNQFFNFVSSFDESDKYKSSVIHPFKRDMINQHIGICENLKSSSISYNNVWHMDNVGKYDLPNIISSFYFDQVPSKGGETQFANLINAYSRIKIKDKMELNYLNAIYEKSNFNIANNTYAPNGFRRLNKILAKDLIKAPLIFYPYNEYSLKSILFSPIRFIKFDKYDEENSWDIMDYIFMNYINIPDNVISIKWHPNDLVIFNNRHLLHTSTPTEIFNSEKRKFKVIFLNTQQKL